MSRLLRMFMLFTFLTMPLGLMAQPIQIVTEEYPPYNYTESGKITGLGTEVVTLVLKEAGITHEAIKSYTWARAYMIAQTTPNVLIYSIGRNAEREKMFKWVGVIAPYNVSLYKLKDNSAIRLATLADAQKYKIGVVRDDQRLIYLKTKGFGHAQLDVSDNDTANIQKLFAKRIDLLPIDEAGAKILTRQKGLDFAKMEKSLPLPELSAGFYMAFSNNTADETVAKCKAALDKIKKDGRYDAIVKKYIK